MSLFTKASAIDKIKEIQKKYTVSAGSSDNESVKKEVEDFVAKHKLSSKIKTAIIKNIEANNKVSLFKIEDKEDMLVIYGIVQFFKIREKANKLNINSFDVDFDYLIQAVSKEKKARTPKAKKEEPAS